MFKVSRFILIFPLCLMLQKGLRSLKVPQKNPSCFEEVLSVNQLFSVTASDNQQDQYLLFLYWSVEADMWTLEYYQLADLFLSLLSCSSLISALSLSLFGECANLRFSQCLHCVPCVIYMIIHPFIHLAFYPGPQPKKCSDRPLPSKSLQFFQVNAKTFPSQPRNCLSSMFVLGLPRGILVVGHAQNTSSRRCPGGNLAKCPNHLNWLLPEHLQGWAQRPFRWMMNEW